MLEVKGGPDNTTVFRSELTTSRLGVVHADWSIPDHQRLGAYAAQVQIGRGSKHGYRGALLTAYVARAISALPVDKSKETPQSKHRAPKSKVQAGQGTNRPANPVDAALRYLRPQVEEVGEPYPIAAYTLAAQAAHRPEAAAWGLKRLATLAHHEAGRAYWALETNTPFYGWGQAGRVETTALVIEALVRSLDAPRWAGDPQLVDQGLRFPLGTGLKHSDRHRK